MRIAIAGQTYYPGNNGQAIFTIHLAEGLARAGHEVHMLVPWAKSHYADELINGVKLHKMRSIDFGWIHPDVWFAFLNAGHIRQLFQKSRPDVVHIQDHYFMARDVTRVARQMHIPILGTNHFLPENVLPYLNVIPSPRKLKISWLWDIMLSTYNHLDMVTTPTETAADILCRQDIHVPVMPVSCGVDTNFFHPAPADRAAACEKFGLETDKTLLFYVGRLDREKRIDLLLKGLAILVERGRKDIFLVIAGQGAAGNELRSLAHTLKLDQQMRFLGYVPNHDLPLLYQTGDIFAMPSPEELQSIATLEAMASGKPILAANARALPELVTHGLNGYLFESNQVNALVDGMIYLADHREEWKNMGLASRSRAVAHSLENTIRRYEDIYTRIQEDQKKASGNPSYFIERILPRKS